jgi:hypothetical protein
MEITNKQLDFITLPKEKSESILELHKKHFVSLVSQEYNLHKVEEKLSYETYLLAQKNKLEYNSPVLNGEYVVEVPNKIPELKYYRMMLNVILKGLNSVDFGIYFKINGLSFQNFDMFLDYMNTIFTDESLITNTLADNITLDLSEHIKEETYFFRRHPDKNNLKDNPIKKYQKGMKFTRFLNSFFETFDKKDKEVEKYIGRFRIDPNDKVKIFISAYLPSIIKAGSVGHSCLSPDGSNEHATFMILGYQNVLVVHDSDFGFRAWLALDHQNKYFTLAHTYPRENFFLQIIVYEFLQSMGYKSVKHYFRFPDYMDMGLSEHFSDTSINPSTYEEDEEKQENKDSYYKFSVSLFNFDGDKSTASNRITNVYGCDGCDKTSINPNYFEDGYCDSCHENNEDYGNCEACDERHHNDYLNYDEENEAYYCEGCRDNIEEEREEARQEEEERQQEEERKELERQNQEEVEGEENGGSADTSQEEIRFEDIERIKVKLSTISLDVGNNLVKKHKADAFYPMMNFIKRLPNIITIRDVALLGTQRSKISNFREFTIFTTLMEAIGINWSDKTSASKYNPIKKEGISTKYPYFMLVEDIQGLATMNNLLYSTNQTDAPGTIQRTNSELYLRYFYLAKNRLQLIKEGSNFYEGALLANANDLTVEEKLSIVQKPYSYADIHMLTPFEKSVKIAFKDAAAYDMYMFIAHQVGFMWNTKVPLWSRAMPTLNQGFDSEYFYVIHNKGFIDTYKADEGAFPQDVVIITKEKMYDYLKTMKQ